MSMHRLYEKACPRGRGDLTRASIPAFGGTTTGGEVPATETLEGL